MGCEADLNRGHPGAGVGIDHVHRSTVVVSKNSRVSERTVRRKDDAMRPALHLDLLEEGPGRGIDDTDGVAKPVRDKRLGAVGTHRNPECSSIGFYGVNHLAAGDIDDLDEALPVAANIERRLVSG